MARQFSLAWTPMISVLHPREVRLHEITGYLPPAELLAHLELALAKHANRSGHPDKGVAIIDQLLERYPSARVAPEALYWKGIMGFFGSGLNKERLFGVWRELAARYPQSEWALKTTLLDWPDSPYLTPPAE